MINNNTKFDDIYVADKQFYDNYIFDNDTDINQIFIGRVENIKEATVSVYISGYDMVFDVPYFFNIQNIEVGGYTLVWLSNLYSGICLGSTTYSQSKLVALKETLGTSDIYDKTLITNGGYTLYLGVDGLSLINADGFKFNINADSTSLRNTISTINGAQYNVDLRQDTSINAKSVRMSVSDLDLTSGDLLSMLKTKYFENTGISIRSFFGDIDIANIVGNVNIVSVINTNVVSLLMTNIVSAGTANISAPFISNLTPGFGAPLIPSPIGFIALKDSINLLANPLRMPMFKLVDNIVYAAKKAMKNV